MRLAIVPVLLCLPACAAMDGDGDHSYPVRGTARVAGAGWSFNFCVGHCDVDLAIDGDDVTLTLTSNTGETPDLVNRGRLSTAAVAELDEIAAALDGQVLHEFYGCPDCADGGASYMRLVVGNVPRRSTWEYGDPPPVLDDADAILLDDVIPALADCVATSRVTLVSCSP